MQRNYNARIRSISPPPGAPAGNGLAGAPLIERAGYHPKVRWSDPEDEEDDDEEARLGVRIDWKDGEDSQAKWKWRRRTWLPEKLRRLLEELGVKLCLVGVPGALFYGFLVRNG